MLHQYENQIIASLQDSLPNFVIEIFGFFTFLGTGFGATVVICLLAWCIDYKLGARFAFLLLFNSIVIDHLKAFFQLPRPFWTDTHIKTSHGASASFGFPSGHAHSSVGWLLIGRYIGGSIGLCFGLFFLLGIGLSRPILGEHYFYQVLSGWGIALFFFFLMLKLEDRVVNWFSKKTLANKLILLLSTSLVVAIASWVFMSAMLGRPIDPLWIANFKSAAGAGEEFNPDAIYRGFNTVGQFSGAFFGMTLMTHFGGFDTKVRLIWRIARFALGITVLLAYYEGFGAFIASLQPGSSLTLLLDFTRLFFLFFNAFFLIPILLSRLGR